MLFRSEASEEFTEIAPEMATAEDAASVEDYAVTDEFVNDVSESEELQ